MSIEKFKVYMELEESDLLRWIAAIKKGDPRCRFQHGDRVYKARKMEEDELTKIGARGTVFGSMWNIRSRDINKDAYWVIWDNGPIVVTTVGSRIESLNEPPRFGLKVKFVEENGATMLYQDNS